MLLVWKDVYHLCKPSVDLVEIKDDDNDKDEDDEEDNTPCVTINVEEYQELMKDGEEEKEDEAKEEDKKEGEDEESDLVRIATEVIASLPHSPPKSAVSSSMKTTSTSVIVTTTNTSSSQSLFSPSQLQLSLMEVSTTSSTKL